VKDRVAKYMIEDAEARGAIEPGHTISNRPRQHGHLTGDDLPAQGYPLKW